MLVIGGAGAQADAVEEAAVRLIFCAQVAAYLAKVDRDRRFAFLFSSFFAAFVVVAGARAHRHAVAAVEQADRRADIEAVADQRDAGGGGLLLGGAIGQLAALV